MSANSDVILKVVRPKPKRDSPIWVIEEEDGVCRWVKATLWKLGTARDGEKKNWAQVYKIPGETQKYWYSVDNFTFDDPNTGDSQNPEGCKPTRSVVEKLSKSKKRKEKIRAVAEKAAENEVSTKAARTALKKKQAQKQKAAAAQLAESKAEADRQLAALVSSDSESSGEESYQEFVGVNRVGKSPRDHTPDRNRGKRSKEELHELYPVGSACLFFSSKLVAGGPQCDEIVPYKDGSTELFAWHLAIVEHEPEFFKSKSTGEDEVELEILVWDGSTRFADITDLLPLEDFYEADAHRLTFGRYAKFPDLCRRYGDNASYVPWEFSKLPVLHAKYNITAAKADEW